VLQAVLLIQSVCCCPAGYLPLYCDDVCLRLRVTAQAVLLQLLLQV
jgi:hypothetical protein